MSFFDAFSTSGGSGADRFRIGGAPRIRVGSGIGSGVGFKSPMKNIVFEDFHSAYGSEADRFRIGWARRSVPEVRAEKRGSKVSVGAGVRSRCPAYSGFR